MMMMIIVAVLQGEEREREEQEKSNINTRKNKKTWHKNSTPFVVVDGGSPNYIYLNRTGTASQFDVSYVYNMFQLF
jgi:hypothetical protein